MLGTSHLTKAALARRLDRSRSSLYYQPKKFKRDWALKQQIEAVLHEHPSYGHRRIALALRLNKKRIRRVMKKFGLKPYRRRGKRYKKIKDFSLKYPNLLLATIPQYRHHVWVSDFTYLGFQGTTVYVGTVYEAMAFRSLLTELGIRISRSRPRSPWENGYQESFYAQFKVELGDPNRFPTLGELVAEIYRLIHYYNTRRIHSVLKMAPLVFAQKLLAS